MDSKTFEELKARVIAAGYGDEIEHYESVKECPDADSFFREFTWVVISSGMKNQIARIIEAKVIEAISGGQLVFTVYGHKGKAAAIQWCYEHQDFLFAKWKEMRAMGSRDLAQLRWLQKLPWIGPITCFHLGKNLGLDVGKPDRHLQRIADGYKMPVAELCFNLADQTGLRVATVDYIIWRAANLGYV